MTHRRVQLRSGRWEASEFRPGREFDAAAAVLDDDEVDPVMAATVAELRRWFEQKVVENQRLFYAIAYQVLGDAHEAEDAVQASVCKAWGSVGELNDPEAVVGWVAKITRHTAIDIRRKRRERATEDEELASMDVGTSDVPLAEQADERAVMRSLIAQLPDNQAIVVTMRFYQDMDGPTIARRLGMTDNAVRVRLHRGLERLEQLLKARLAKKEAGAVEPSE
jgi:RNA polymerase sigma factor (sigma-70 family)